MRSLALTVALLAASGWAPGRASAQGVTEEVEGGGALSAEDLAAIQETEAPPEEGEPPVDALPEDTAAAALGTPTPPRELAPEPIDYTLGNGLRVLLQPFPGRRFVATAVSYRVGAADSPEGWSGLAHLAEHAQFAGTDAHPGPELLLRLEAAGAVVHDGVTSLDRVELFNVLPAAQLSWALWVESERMARAATGLTEANLDRQRRLLLNEGAERGTYGGSGRLRRALLEAITPPGHPYRGAVERAEDVRAMRPRHVQWFLQRHFAPDQATLAVVGGFDPAQARAEIARRFGPIARSGPAPAAAPSPGLSPLPRAVRRRVVIEGPARVVVAWPSPARFAEGDAALEVFASALTDGPDAPLRALVSRGLAARVTAEQRGHARGGVFRVEAEVAEGESVEALLRAIDAVVEASRAPGPDAIARARARWIGRARARLEDLEAWARALAGATDAYVPSAQRERARYGGLDAAGVAVAVDRWLPSERRAVVIGVAAR